MFEKIIIHDTKPERAAASEGNFYPPKEERTGPGMNPRIRQLRKLSVETEPSLSIERALHETAFYRENLGKLSIPVLRAANFYHHCQHKAIYLG
ncbi:MAG TPA: pyruvate formate lyase family protein, partial [Prolixibacteraceae bacterium]|nr:pyruvate formate lyase family protein [Prolixibacteraceae bacterium]